MFNYFYIQKENKINFNWFPLQYSVLGVNYYFTLIDLIYLTSLIIIVSDMSLVWSL